MYISKHILHYLDFLLPSSFEFTERFRKFSVLSASLTGKNKNQLRPSKTLTVLSSYVYAKFYFRLG